jgi:hypothetical protein
MKKCSKAISEHTGKPEEWIGVSITDNACVLFGYVNTQCFAILYITNLFCAVYHYRVSYISLIGIFG